MLLNVSYRYKVPLMLSATILLTGFVVSMVLTWRAYEDLREDLVRNAVEVGGMLSGTMIPALKHDDLWSAYRALDSANSASSGWGERLLIVLNEEHQVYVSNEPKRFPILSELRAQGPELARLEEEIVTRRPLEPYVFDPPENKNIYVAIPMLEDGIAAGVLVVGYSRTLFPLKFYEIVKSVAYSALLVLAVLLPVGWYVGNRAVSPLIKLAACMDQVGRLSPDQIQCRLIEGEDEIGRLGASFHCMLTELGEKQYIEQQMVISERLVAVGRLTAGIAHEINNPLGGMVNAINTFRRHGRPDTVTEKTLSLLERGLGQISDTVSALLVEARPESHALTPEDVDDVYTLVQPDARKKRVQIDWNNGLQEPIPLPSTPVRQVLLNLSLNAVQAAPDGGSVVCEVQPYQDRLRIHVNNEGEAIPPERINSMFEPFVHFNPSGSGLGLWVIYQIVQQLNGEIEVSSDMERTCFTVYFPLDAAV